MIRELEESDIIGLNTLPPLDWKYDYEQFLMDFIGDEFFSAFVILVDNKIVGTGNVLLKGKVGWLANIIINEKYRGKGLGTEMTKHLVDVLHCRGCKTQLLIATELGERVYQKIGFRKISDYLCFDSEEDSDTSFSASIRKLELSDLESVYKLDMEANDENRKHLIDKFHGSGVGFYNNKNELLGFYLPHFGRGLVISKDQEAGIELLNYKHLKKGKRTLIPVENLEGIQFLEKNGLKKGGKSSRMVLGELNHWKPENIYSYGSGYCG